MGEPSVPKLDVRVRVHHDDSGKAELLGFADLVIAGSFVVKGLKILKTKGDAKEPGSVFVGYPSRKGTGESEGRYFEVAHPVTAAMRTAVTEAVLKAYPEARRSAPAAPASA